MSNQKINNMFGRKLLGEFPSQGRRINLNNGSYGNPPNVVLEMQTRVRGEISRDPEMWFRKGHGMNIKNMMEVLAQRVGAEADCIVPVQNTTYGIESVLKSIKWRSGDRILISNVAYEMVVKQVKRIHREFGVVVVVVELPLPCPNSDIIKAFRDTIENNKIRLAIVEHIVSVPAVLFPVHEIVQLLRQHGAQVLVDAAHVFGQIPHLQISAINADYYVSDLHKWGYVARSCALLYVDRQHHKSVIAAITNYNYGDWNSLQSQFLWTGTYDFSALATIPAALEFRQKIGGETAVYNYCHNLALEVGAFMAGCWKTEVMQLPEQTACMVDVRLPDGMGHKGLSMELYKKTGIYVPIYPWRGQWWMRLSLQVWNELGDVQKLIGTSHI